MVRQARESKPDAEYYVGEISTWKLPKKYDLISAWDSTFHLPIRLHEPALRNMCEGLEDGGILIFTCGGRDEPGEITGNFWDEDFEYATLGLLKYFELLAKFSCAIKHVEFDQGPSEEHVYIIAQKQTVQK